MLLFYGVVTRARKSLVLIYPAVGSSGEPLYASPYVTAVEDLFEPGAFRVDQCHRHVRLLLLLNLMTFTILSHQR